MAWLRRRRKMPEPPEDPALQAAEQHVQTLRERARHVERVLAPRHARNHWSETVERLYRGEAPQ